VLVSLFLLAAAQGRSQEVDYEQHEGGVRALRGERLLWENRHWFGPAGGLGSELLGPVVSGDVVYYVFGISVYEVDAATGVVRRRMPMPERPSSLDLDGDAVRVTIEGQNGGAPWKTAYRVGPALPAAPPFFLSGSSPLYSRATRREAELLANLDRKDASPTERVERLEAAAELLGRRAERDVTNPWLHYWRGRCLAELGRADEATAAYHAALALDTAYDNELLGMALLLDEVSEALGQQAFERGMRFLLERGFEPETNLSLLNVVVSYGQPERPLDPVQDLPRLNRQGERMLDLAPNAEGVAFLYQGLAEANRAAGQAEESAKWEARAREALPFRSWGGRVAAFTGAAFNLFLACALAGLLCLFVRGLYRWGQRRGARGLARWNPFSAWGRGEIVGLLIVIGVFLWASAHLVRGTAAVVHVAGLPLGTVAGNPGHPAGVEYLAGWQGTPGGDFVYALALQKAGELERSAALYERLGTARATNNLGVIRWTQGRQDDARRLFERALASEPALAEAAFNLGRPADSARVARARQYGLAPPLSALPTLDMWDEAFVGKSPGLGDIGRLLSMFTLVQTLADAGGPAVARAGLVDAGGLFSAALILLVVLAVVGLFVRAPEPSLGGGNRVSIVGWALGFLIPGTSRRLGVLGPPLAALGVLSWLVWYSLRTSSGIATNIIDAIALPNVTRTYGLSAMVWPPHDALLARLAPVWWALLLLNVVVLVTLELRRPDPLGARGRSQER